MRDYYNEFDPHAAQWLRNLIEAGVLPAGDVDERDVRDVAPSEIVGYRRCHFFAGIGVWAYADECKHMAKQIDSLLKAYGGEA